RRAVQQAGQVAGQVGVPGVGVHEVRAGAVGGHRQVDADRPQGGVGARQLDDLRVGGGALLRALRPEAADLHVQVAAGTQGTHQLCDVHPRTAVDVGRVLTAQDVDAHG